MIEKVRHALVLMVKKVRYASIIMIKKCLIYFSSND